MQGWQLGKVTGVELMFHVTTYHALCSNHQKTAHLILQ